MYPLEEEIEIYSQRFKSSEAAYQYCAAMYSRDFDSANKILKAASGKKAMEIGSGMKKPKDWHANKEGEMRKILEKKAEKSKSFIEALKKCTGKTIIEDTSHTFWGRGTSEIKGDNKMGIILMDLTEQIFGEGKTDIVSDAKNSEVSKIVDTMG